MLTKRKNQIPKQAENVKKLVRVANEAKQDDHLSSDWLYTLIKYSLITFSIIALYLIFRNSRYFDHRLVFFSRDNNISKKSPERLTPGQIGSALKHLRYTDPGFFTTHKDSFLSKKIAELPLDIEDEDKLTPDERKNIKPLRKAIRENILKALPAPLLIKILSIPEFEIIIIPKQEMQKHASANAVTLPEYYKMYICADIPPFHVLPCLKNEFHHFAVYTRNSENILSGNGNFSSLYVMPFMREDGNDVDTKKLLQLKAALYDGLAKLKQAYLNDYEQLDNELKDFHGYGLSHFNMSKAEFKKYKRVEGNVYQQDPVVQIRIHNKFDNGKDGLGVTWSYVHDGLFVRKTDEIIKNLKKEFEKFEKLELKMGIMQLASSIDEFPPNIKKKYFSDFCDFFNEFHQIPDYCEVGQASPK